jgi:hypothetical protein
MTAVSDSAYVYLIVCHFSDHRILKNHVFNSVVTLDPDLLCFQVFLAPPTTECQDHPEQPIAIILNFNVALPPHGESLPKISP